MQNATQGERIKRQSSSFLWNVPGPGLPQKLEPFDGHVAE
jgi:hypothetical protein